MIDTLNFERQIMTEPKSENWITDDVLLIVLMHKNPLFKETLKPYELSICGKKMWEWVVMCADDCVVKTTTCTEESNILQLIKPLLIDTKYTAVLYSDTPLIQKSTFEDIMNYVRGRDMNVLKLTRGFVFNTEYIKSATEISATQTQYFNEEDFITVNDNKQLALVTDIMNKRILNFHLNNGVYIEDINSVHIDADVIIEGGAKILANNMIKGLSIIQKNALIGFGNFIESSIISVGASVTQSCIIESKICENMQVGPFELLKRKSV